MKDTTPLGDKDRYGFFFAEGRLVGFEKLSGGEPIYICRVPSALIADSIAYVMNRLIDR